MSIKKSSSLAFVMAAAFGDPTASAWACMPIEQVWFERRHRSAER